MSDYDDILLCNRPSTKPITLSSDEVQERLYFYPNPTNGILHIDSYKNIKQVFVSSISGERNDEVKIENGKIDLSKYKSGVYMLKTISNGDEIHHGKVILIK